MEYVIYTLLDEVSIVMTDVSNKKAEMTNEEDIKEKMESLKEK